MLGSDLLGLLDLFPLLLLPKSVALLFGGLHLLLLGGDPLIRLDLDLLGGLDLRLGLLNGLLHFVQPLLVARDSNEFLRGLNRGGLRLILKLGGLDLSVPKLLRRLGRLLEAREFRLHLQLVERIHRIGLGGVRLLNRLVHQLVGLLVEVLRRLPVRQVGLHLDRNDLLHGLLDDSLRFGGLLLGFSRLLDEILQLGSDVLRRLLGELVVVLRQLLLHHIHVVQDVLHRLDLLKKLVHANLGETLADVLNAVRREIGSRIRLLLRFGKNQLLHRRAEHDHDEQRAMQQERKEPPQRLLAATLFLALANLVGKQVVVHSRSSRLLLKSIGRVDADHGQSFLLTGVNHLHDRTKRRIDVTVQTDATIGVLAFRLGERGPKARRTDRPGVDIQLALRGDGDLDEIRGRLHALGDTGRRKLQRNLLLDLLQLTRNQEEDQH